MRVALVAFSDGQTEKLRNATRCISAALGSRGFEAELFGSAEPRVSYFDFVVVCASFSGSAKAFSLFSKERLDAGAKLEGKRSMAILLKSGLWQGKKLAILMSSMESQGMVVTMGEAVGKESEIPSLIQEAPVVRG